MMSSSAKPPLPSSFANSSPLTDDVICEWPLKKNFTLGLINFSCTVVGIKEVRGQARALEINVMKKMGIA